MTSASGGAGGKAIQTTRLGWGCGYTDVVDAEGRPAAQHHRRPPVLLGQLLEERVLLPPRHRGALLYHRQQPLHRSEVLIHQPLGPCRPPSPAQRGWGGQEGTRMDGHQQWLGAGSRKRLGTSNLRVTGHPSPWSE